MGREARTTTSTSTGNRMEQLLRAGAQPGGLSDQHRLTRFFALRGYSLTERGLLGRLRWLFFGR